MSEAAFSAYYWLVDWSAKLERMAQSAGNPEKQICRDALAEIIDMAEHLSA